MDDQNRESVCGMKCAHELVVGAGRREKEREVEMDGKEKMRERDGWMTGDERMKRNQKVERRSRDAGLESLLLTACQLALALALLLPLLVLPSLSSFSSLREQVLLSTYLPSIQSTRPARPVTSDASFSLTHRRSSHRDACSTMTLGLWRCVCRQAIAELRH